jgi:hypothetical protein
VATEPSASRTWTPFTIANAALAIALEVGLLAGLCFWGFTVDGNWLARTLLGMGAPIGAGLLWWLFLAAGGPKYSVPVAAQVALKLAIFGAGSLALYGSGLPAPGLVFAALSIVSVATEVGTR